MDVSTKANGMRSVGRRVLVGGMLGSALVGGTLAGPASAHTGQTASARPVSLPKAGTTYLATARSGDVERLMVVDRHTGRVVRTLDKADGKGIDDPFGDVTQTADGTIYAVLVTGGSESKEQLIKYSPDGSRRVLANDVVSAAVSPSGRQIAVFTSAWGAHDVPTYSLRVLRSDGSVKRTLATSTSRKNSAWGEPATWEPRAWIGETRLAVDLGSDSSHAAVVDATRATPSSKYVVFPKTASGVIGTKGGRVLVKHEVRKAARTGGDTVLRYDAYWFDPASKRSTPAGSARAPRHSGAEDASYQDVSGYDLAKRNGVKPSAIPAARVKWSYRGPGKLSLAFPGR